MFPEAAGVEESKGEPDDSDGESGGAVALCAPPTGSGGLPAWSSVVSIAPPSAPDVDDEMGRALRASMRTFEEEGGILAEQESDALVPTVSPDARPEPVFQDLRDIECDVVAPAAARPGGEVARRMGSGGVPNAHGGSAPPIPSVSELLHSRGFKKHIIDMINAEEFDLDSLGMLNEDTIGSLAHAHEINKSQASRLLELVADIKSERAGDDAPGATEHACARLAARPPRRFSRVAATGSPFAPVTVVTSDKTPEEVAQLVVRLVALGLHVRII